MNDLFRLVRVFAIAAPLVAGCGAPQVPPASGSRARMDSLLSAYEYAWENQDPDTLEHILTSGFTRTFNQDQSVGVDSLKRLITGGPVSNIMLDFDEPVYGENLGAVSWTLRGTLGQRPVEFTGASFFTIVEGKLASERVFSDTAPVLQRLSITDPAALR